MYNKDKYAMRKIKVPKFNWNRHFTVASLGVHTAIAYCALGSIEIQSYIKKYII